MAAARLICGFYAFAMVLAVMVGKPMTAEEPRPSNVKPEAAVSVPAADPPAPVPLSLTIEGGRDVEPGAIIRLNAVSDGATRWEWRVVDTSNPTEIADLEMADEVNGGQSLLLASKPGKIYAAFVSVTDPTGRQAVAVAVVRVSGKQPGPGPGPTPPNPDVPPVGTLGLSKVTIDRKPILLSADMKKDAAALAANYRAVIAQAKALPDASLDSLRDSLRSLNRTTLPQELRARWDNWQKEIGIELERLEAGKRIDGVAGAVKAWDEIATGLEWLVATEGR